MDPTAPNNNDPKKPKFPQSPIQPGQFVTTGEEETAVFKQAPPLQPQLGAQAPLSPNPQPQPEPEPKFENQPSPTPYVAPAASGQPPASAPSTIAKLRVFLIIFGFLLLVGLIASVAYLFVFKKSGTQESAKTSAGGQVVELPSPPPARRTGGFSELPQATEEAEEEEDEESTPSAQ